MSQRIICRLCLLDNLNYFSIFGDFHLKLQEKILKYLSLSIKDNILICTKCVEKIESFHQFYIEVHQKVILPVNQIIANTNELVQASPAYSMKTEMLDNLNESIEEPKSPKINDVESNLVEIVQEQNSVVQNQTIVPSSSSEFRYLILLEDQIPKVEEKLEQDLINSEEISQTTPIDPRKTCLKESQKMESAQQISKESSVKQSKLQDEIEYDDDEEDEESTVPKEIDEVSKPNRNVDSSEFPKELIKDGKLTIKGKELTKLISKFYRLECDLCKPKDSKVFKKLSSLITHYKNVHKLKGYVICCGAKYVKVRNMAMHLARHLQPNAFKCPECKKFLTCPKILQYHIQNHLPEEKRPLACPEPGCTRRFSYQSALVTHSISHIDESERVSWCCDECGKVFSASGRLSTHINMAHTKNFEYICHICAKHFSCKSNLTYHLQTHEPYSHQLECQVCGKFLKNKLCLRKHMSLHSSVKHFCNLCDYSANNKQCLRNHMNIKHSDEKKFECQVCGKSFKLKNTLVNHMVQHTGIKKYFCEFCVRSFASSGNYYSHRKRMHSQALAEFLKNKEKLDEERRKEAIRLKQVKNT